MNISNRLVELARKLALGVEGVNWVITNTSQVYIIIYFLKCNLNHQDILKVVQFPTGSLWSKHNYDGLLLGKNEIFNPILTILN